MSLLRRLLSGKERVRDPVCGMVIPTRRARDQTDYEGVTYHFCSAACRKQFDEEPRRYAGVASEVRPSGKE